MKHGLSKRHVKILQPQLLLPKSSTEARACTTIKDRASKSRPFSSSQRPVHLRGTIHPHIFSTHPPPTFILVCLLVQIHFLLQTFGLHTIRIKNALRRSVSLIPIVSLIFRFFSSPADHCFQSRHGAFQPRSGSARPSRTPSESHKPPPG